METINAMLAEIGLNGASLISIMLVVACTTFLSFALCTAFVVLMPKDYFSLKRHPPTNRQRWPGAFKFWLRNVGGVFLMVAGAILSIPGIPFPGTILILIGFSILDFQSKRKMQQKFLKRPSVQGRINSLRKKFGKPPIVLGC